MKMDGIRKGTIGGCNALRIALFVCFALASAATAFGGELARQCGTPFTPQYTRTRENIGGKHITASGTLRVLIVFASFPDDETPNAFWPAHSAPLFMQQFIDPDTSTNSQASFNLTNYFHQMSMGKFHLVGEALWVETAHSQEEYRNGSYGRANMNVLQERVDPLVDFSQYDQWTRVENYNQVNVPDGQVDMIIMVWRTNIFQYLGEASLGYKPGFLTDGKRIEMGFPEYLPFPLGSGVTCEFLYGDSPYKAMQTMVHELGHWLLGGAHPYDGTTIFGKHAYWGILSNGQRVASCANAYERETLGWITVPAIEPEINTSLPDFLTTGAALKYHPDNGEPFEYFYIENHQKLSVFDDATANPDDKGIWILHQQGPYMEFDNLKIKPADGNWNWENPGMTMSCFSQELPIFKKGAPKVGAGQSHRDQIPMQTSLVNWLNVFKDPAGEVHCGSFNTGEMFLGAMNANGGAVFSRYSNPNSNTWDNQQTSFSLELVNELNGVITVRYNSNPLDAAPARRYCGTDPTVQGTPPGWIALAWGSQWTQGQPLEADVNWSELQQQIGLAGNWNTVYEGSTTSWSDGSIRYDTNGAVPVFFRVRVRDTQGKYSAWSNVFYTKIAVPNGVDDYTHDAGTISDHYELAANYPNPFNPATTIAFSLPEPSRVLLSISDVLGREVRRLIDASLAHGAHAISWDGTDNAGAKVAGGVYIYRLQASRVSGHDGSFVSAKKMILLK